MSGISRRNDALMEIAGQANAALESGPAASDDGGMTTLTLSDTTIERIILALQVMATERTEPAAERAAYFAALNEVGEAVRAT